MRGDLSKGSQTVRKGERGLVYRQLDCKEGREGTCLQADLGLTVHKSDRASYPFFVTHPRKLLHTHQVACQCVYITARSLS